MSDDGDELGGDLSYEEQRIATIRSNAELLASLGLQAAGPTQPKDEERASRPVKQPKTKSSRTSIPTRRSSRIENATTEHQKLPDDWDDSYDIPSKRKRTEVSLPKLPKVIIPAETAVRYAEGEEGKDEDYSLQPVPARMVDGTERLIFEGRWKGVFEPNLTPEEVFRRGAFGGNYYADEYSNVLKRPLHSTEDLEELPPSWFEPPDPIAPETHLTAPSRVAEVNRYGVHAGQGLREWEKSGWIWEGDPRGWMQWYTRFYYGRRCPDDVRQVQRWLNLAGPSGRFARSLMKKVAQYPGGGGMTAGNTALHDEEVGRVLRQVNHQWAWQLNLGEWQRRLLQ